MTLTLKAFIDASTDVNIGPFPATVDVSLVRAAGATWAYVQSADPGGLFGVMRLRADGTFGAMTFYESIGAGPENAEIGMGLYQPFDPRAPSGFDAITLDGTRFVIGSHALDFAEATDTHGLHFYSVEIDGSLTLEGVLSRDTGSVQEVKSFTVDGNPLILEIVTPATGTTRMAVLDVNGDLVADRYWKRPDAFENGAINAVGEINGNGFVFFTRSDNDKLSWVRFDARGAGNTQGTLENSGTYGAAADMELVSVIDHRFLDLSSFAEGRSFVVVADARGVLRSYEATFEFDIGQVDRVGTARGAADWQSTEIASFSYDGRAFIVTGGQVARVYEMTRDGAFFLQTELSRTETAHEAEDIDIQVRGDTARIVFDNVEGVSVYDYDIGPAARRFGTNGEDRMRGDSRDNEFFGRDGNDVLWGYQGNDKVNGGGGNDVVYGGYGADHVYGEAGRDQLFGGAADDYINGGGGNDRAYGGSGSDSLSGGFSSDSLSGGGGQDNLYGGAGSDILIGGKGRDFLFGGGKSDRFVFAADGSRDVIYDWQGQDVIEMRGFSNGARFRDISFTDRRDGGVLIEIEGETMLIRGRGDLDPSDFSRADFDFV